MFIKTVSTLAAVTLLSSLTFVKVANANELRIVQQLKKAAPQLAKKFSAKKNLTGLRRFFRNLGW